MAQTRKAEESKTKQQDKPKETATGEHREPNEISEERERQGSPRQNQPLTGGTKGSGLSRTDTIASPFSFMRRFSEEMDRLFEDFGFGGSSLSRTLGGGFGREFQQMAAWSPQIEFFEQGNEIVIRADLPGMSKNDVNVDVEEDEIVIRGERRDERESNEEGFYHSERSYGSFYRSFPLPLGVDGEKVGATFANGVLEITIPKPEQRSRSRRIEIGG